MENKDNRNLEEEMDTASEAEGRRRDSRSSQDRGNGRRGY